MSSITSFHCEKPLHGSVVHNGCHHSVSIDIDQPQFEGSGYTRLGINKSFVPAVCPPV